MEILVLGGNKAEVYKHHWWYWGDSGISANGATDFVDNTTTSKEQGIIWGF